MPIYEYRCQGCGTTFEKIQSSTQDTPPCPACGAVAQRTVSATAAPPADAGTSTAGCGSGGFT